MASDLKQIGRSTMGKVLSTFWIFVSILLMFCVTPTAFTQQKPTEVKDLQYVETVDLRELVDTVKDLTRNVKILSDNVKELTDNVKELTKSVNNINTSMNGVETRMAVIEERTTWIRGLLYILLAAIVGTIVTPIILHILSNRGKQNTSIPTVNTFDEVKKENQDEPPDNVTTEDMLKTETETS